MLNADAKGCCLGGEKHHSEDQVKDKEEKEKKNSPTQKKVEKGKNYSNHNKLACIRSFLSLVSSINAKNFPVAIFLSTKSSHVFTFSSHDTDVLADSEMKA